jgi:hypothetical protein
LFRHFAVFEYVFTVTVLFSSLSFPYSTPFVQKVAGVFVRPQPIQQNVYQSAQMAVLHGKEPLQMVSTTCSSLSFPQPCLSHTGIHIPYYFSTNGTYL